ncbi:MAG: glycosyltransferase [Deltaproteobacteria bacterium]|nr:glycosyltransferase [Deltaproteobacteria bacterium]MCX7953086.1 glycosyltransferase [Deltaproteobacteria bacterium]
MTYLSVVIPCFNEEEVLGITLSELKRELDAWLSDYEIILVDDGSEDKTWEIIKELSTTDNKIKGIRLSRNFGHQYALSCGLFHAQGAVTAIIDADLQDPPSLIKPMVEKLNDGFDVVYGRRKKRHGERAIKRLTAYWFYRVIKKLSGLNIPEDTGDFRVVSRRALDAFLKMPERHRFVRGMFAWIGFKQAAWDYDRPERAAGKTKYPILKSFLLALDAVVSFSKIPLRLATLLGFSFACFSGLYLILVIILFIFGINFPGYTSLMASILLLGGVQLICLGILGEYVGRIYEQTQFRPLFIVQETVGDLKKVVLSA